MSCPGRSRLDDPDRLFAAMRESGVGGAFWLDTTRRETEENERERAILRWIAGEGEGGDRRVDAIRAIEEASYRNPFTGAPCDAHEAVHILSSWQSTLIANRKIVAAIGMSGWKREAIGRFLWDGEKRPPFLSAERALALAEPGHAVAYWPSRTPADFPAEAEQAGVAAWQVEDGFLRSAGLGAECRPPLSILVDRLGGIHYAPDRASELENILAGEEFSEPLLCRARALREQIVAARLGKYGIDEGPPPPPLPAGRKIVLAIGQVADDLAVTRNGQSGMSDFMCRVRQCEPDAFIIYRPHPDVMAGLRDGAVPGSEDADLVLGSGSLLALLEKAHAVHVFSSLTGFEALLRGLEVTVHGMPFYAGWGLTRDLCPVPSRRGRPLSLDALVAGALILAPRYLDPETELPCPPEVIVDRLRQTRRRPYNVLTGFRRAYGAARLAMRPAVRRQG